MTGLEEDIEARARRELKEEQERDGPRHKPLWTRADGRGNVTAIANPAGHPGVPTQASPPGPGARQGFSVPLIPGLGS